MTRPMPTEQPELFPVAPAAPDEDVFQDDWAISVRLTLAEVEAVAEGTLPATLVDYCRDGLIALRGTPAEAMLRANERLRQARAAEGEVIHDAAAS